MTSIERGIAEVLGALALILGFVFYEQHKGAEKCEAADTVAVTRELAANQEKALSESKQINDEAKTYAQVLADPAPADSPHVSLCHYTPAAVPQAAAARSVTDGKPASRSPDTPTARDVGPPLVKVGADVDGQVRGLQAYITQVCLAK